MVDVAHLADGGHAVGEHLAHLTRGQAKQGVRPFLGHQLGVGAGGAAELSAAAGVQLDVVDDRAHRNPGQHQRVARLDVRSLAGEDLVAHLEAQGSQDVALLAICVVQKGDARAAVGVVLDKGNAGWHAGLVATEVDLAVQALVPAATAARGDAAEVVAAGLLAQASGQGRLRRAPGDLLKGGDGLEPASSRSGFYLADGHL